MVGGIALQHFGLKVAKRAGECKDKQKREPGRASKQGNFYLPSTLAETKIYENDAIVKNQKHNLCLCLGWRQQLVTLFNVLATSSVFNFVVL